jgi:hypothetical protein
MTSGWLNTAPIPIQPTQSRSSGATSTCAGECFCLRRHFVPAGQHRLAPIYAGEQRPIPVETGHPRCVWYPRTVPRIHPRRGNMAGMATGWRTKRAGCGVATR